MFVGYLVAFGVVGVQGLAMKKVNRWNSGSTISVGFLDNCPSEIRELVKKTVPEWTPHTNIKFDFKDSSKGDVTISCDPAKGHNSIIGPGSRNVQPSMNLGFDGSSGPSGDERVRLILHEFGHVLGFEHEQFNPKAPFKLSCDDPKVVEEANKNNLHVQNYCKQLPENDAVVSRFDPESIMYYILPKSLVPEQYSNRRNVHLSELDKSTAREAYGVEGGYKEKPTEPEKPAPETKTQEPDGPTPSVVLRTVVVKKVVTVPANSA